MEMRNHQRNNPARITFLLAMAFAFLFPISAGAAAKMKPEHKEFLSVVRYIITRQEQKVFKKLPEENRDAFIEEFWRKRDPDPYTETNEFRDAYFARIEEANQLFRGEGSPGWLGDRGRVYILLGPPDRRDTYPSGRRIPEPPLEVWYYGFFPIVFLDFSWSGAYKLEPDSAWQVAKLNQAAMALKPRIDGQEGELPFHFTVKPLFDAEKKSILQIILPYRQIRLQPDPDGESGRAEILVHIEVRSPSGVLVRDLHDTFPIVLKKTDLDALQKNHTQVIRLDLPPGTYKLTVDLENKIDASRNRQTLDWEIK